MQIVIIRSWKRLYVYIGKSIDQQYPIAIGAPSTPTPLGVYRIVNKALNPGGPYGTRWMGLSLSGYGIHGTNNPSSIGKSISLGCIRMYNQDIEYLYNLTPIGTVVQIIESPANLPEDYQKPLGIPYVVRNEDTIFSIAKQHNCTVETLISMNNLIYTEGHIYPGQTLIII